MEYWRARTRNKSFCHYFVDDGSIDETYELLLSLASFSPTKIKVLKLRKNVGKAEALRHGLMQALEDNPGVKLIGYCDGDSTVLSDDILNLIKIMEENKFDLVLASRVMLLGRSITRTTRRHIIGRIVVTVLGVGHNNFPYDPQNGLKLLRNSAGLKESLTEPFKTRWFVDIEIMLRMRQLGMTMFWEEPLLHWEESGESHLSLRSIPRIIHELFIVRRLLRKWI